MFCVRSLQHIPPVAIVIVDFIVHSVEEEATYRLHASPYVSVSTIKLKIHIERWYLLQLALLRENCFLLITPGAQCFRGMLLLSLQVVLHVLFLDLISRCEDIDRKRCIATQNYPFLILKVKLG